MKHFRLLLLLASAASAQSIEPPAIGHMLDASGTLRKVHGIPGAFITGQPEATGILGAACNATLCLTKTADAILSPTGATAAPPGRALITLDSSSAWLYFPETHQFAKWQADTLTYLNWPIDGKVLAVGRTPGLTNVQAGDPLVAVLRATGTWLATSTGALAEALPAEGPVLLLPTAILYATPDELILNTHHIPLPNITHITQLGEHYAQITTPTAIYALHLETAQLHQLPNPRRRRSRP